MTLRDFNGLTDAGKDEVVMLWGDYLTENVVPGFRVTVYKLANFFVEVYHDTKTDHIKKFRGCLDTIALYGA
ncbi:MAG TPA: hypothetical protein VNS32_14180 [Flavisolibacter sp.]|nr:hypothetical protein [Flavisolibacter sp.]